MKRLAILTIVAVMTVATSGCAQWRCWFRGDDCMTCGGAEYSNSGMYTSDPIYEGTILPPPTGILPEPQSAGQ